MVSIGWGNTFAGGGAIGVNGIGPEPGSKVEGNTAIDPSLDTSRELLTPLGGQSGQLLASAGAPMTGA